MNRVCFLSAFLVFSASTLAYATTIDFEQYPEGTSITTQYSAEDIVFSGGAVQRTVPNYNFVGFPPHSGIGVLGSPGGPITATFATPVSGVSGFYSDAGTFTIDAYNSANLLISSIQYGADLGSSDPFTVVGSGISSIVFSSSTGPATMTLDDLSFTPAVPEPGSIALVGTGMLGLAAACGRRLRKA